MKGAITLPTGGKIGVKSELFFLEEEAKQVPQKMKAVTPEMKGFNFLIPVSMIEEIKLFGSVAGVGITAAIAKLVQTGLDTHRGAIEQQRKLRI